MNQVERLRAKLIEQFPGYDIPITKPVRADGTWMVDVIGPDRFIAIAWRADKGFGVTTPTENDLTTTNDGFTRRFRRPCGGGRAYQDRRIASQLGASGFLELNPLRLVSRRSSPNGWAGSGGVARMESEASC